MAISILWLATVEFSTNARTSAANMASGASWRVLRTFRLQNTSHTLCKRDAVAGFGDDL